MLLSPWLAYLLDISIVILTGILCGWIVSKLSQKLVFLLGPLAGISAGIFIWTNYAVVVIDYNGGKTIDKKIAIWKSSFTASDGQYVPLTMNSGNDVFIVNETDSVLAIERIYYGEHPVNPDYSTKIIHSHCSLPVKNVPDFYPWENPSDKILVDPKIEGLSEVRTWLRKESY